MDIFGNTDPNKMPQHFFWDALSVDYDTAVRANTEKQNYSVCPRYWYIDTHFTCDRCRQEFIWSIDEQKTWFEDYYFWVDAHPRQCRDCRVERRHLSKMRKEYDAIVADARKQGSPGQKQRIVEIVSELEHAFGHLPEKMIETKKLFERQMSDQADQSEDK